MLQNCCCQSCVWRDALKREGVQDAETFTISAIVCSDSLLDEIGGYFARRRLVKKRPQHPLWSPVVVDLKGDAVPSFAIDFGHSHSRTRRVSRVLARLLSIKFEGHVQLLAFLEQYDLHVWVTRIEGGSHKIANWRHAKCPHEAADSFVVSSHTDIRVRARIGDIPSVPTRLQTHS